ncbi:unnamed protein product [Meloidogyne enterolobii]|uniref:Uncharacterized protein n=1 Tax=Meloidogyne enterolobii TaxID=390850 RepID=A0ACB0YWN8_MELEN
MITPNSFFIFFKTPSNFQRINEKNYFLNYSMGPKMADEEILKFQLDKNERNIEEEEEGRPIIVNFEGGGCEEGGSDEDEEDEEINRDYKNISSNSSIEAPSTNVEDCYTSALNNLVGDNEEDNEGNNSRHYFGNYTRYLVMFITTMCLSMSMANSLALNFTVICMHKDSIVNSNLTTGEDSTQKGKNSFPIMTICPILP